jgi:transcriptional regulator with XRE-family HTH domain
MTRNISSAVAPLAVEGTAVQRFSDIIERVERIRVSLKLNKSQFAKLVGLTPQTYNNFVGAQGSKPNVELLHGLVTQVGVNPLWILTGRGTAFLGKASEVATPFAQFDQHRGQLEGTGGVAAFGESQDNALSTLEPLLRRVEDHLRRLETGPSPLLDRLQSVLVQYSKTNPDDVRREVEDLLRRIEGHLTSGTMAEMPMGNKA